jgi:hypothetical protein
MGKPTLDMSRIRFCTLIFLTPFLFQFFSCSQKREIDPQEIVGRWELVSKGVKPIAYIELSFYKDSTAMFDCLTDTVIYLRYRIRKDSLYLKDLNNNCTRDLILSLDGNIFYLCSLKKCNEKLIYKKRNDTLGKFDTSFVKSIIPAWH